MQFVVSGIMSTIWEKEMSLNENQLYILKCAAQSTFQEIGHDLMQLCEEFGDGELTHEEAFESIIDADRMERHCDDKEVYKQIMEYASTTIGWNDLLKLTNGWFV